MSKQVLVNFENSAKNLSRLGPSLKIETWVKIVNNVHFKHGCFNTFTNKSESVLRNVEPQVSSNKLRWNKTEETKFF